MRAAAAVDTLLLLGLVLGGLVARQVYRALVSPRERNRRRLLDTPRTPIGQLRPGTARVTGKARRGSEVLRAPISARPCLAFEFRVEVSEADGGWEEVVSQRQACSFKVADDGGEAIVDPGSHFELVLAEDVRGGTGVMDGTPEPLHLAAVLAMLDESEHPDPGRGRKVRYFEGVLEEGGLVSLWGPVVEEVHPDAERVGPRASPVASILRGNARDPLRIGGGEVARIGLHTDNR